MDYAKKDIEILLKENKLLKTQLKQKDEVIHDLDKYNYREQCHSMSMEIKELLKKSSKLRKSIRHHDKKRECGQ